MIKDVMVRLDGGSGDDARLAAATQIAEIFQSHITGLFLNVVPDEFNGANVKQATQTPDAARRAGDAVETMLFQRLTQLQQPTNLRRFDVTGVLDISGTALPVVRTADTFVALRPNDRSNEPEDLIENLLFGTGRHLFLVPDDWKGFTPLGACPNSRCSIVSESDSSLGHEQVFSPLEYRSDAASAAECAGLRAERPRLPVYR